MVQKLIRTACLSVALLLVGCAASFDPADAYQDMTAKQIYNEGTKNLMDGYYTDSIQYYQTYDARYPFGDDIESVQLDIIYAYYEKGETAQSLAAAERFIHLHPSSTNVDYAYYMKGLSNFVSNIGTLDKYMPVDFALRDLTPAKKAFLDFSELVHRFPTSRYVSDAKRHMIFLRNLLANHEYEVALFYYEHEAYVAAANRANEVVRHFQGAPVVAKAMVLMIKSYHELGLETLAADASKVLELNIPDVPNIT